MNLITQGYGTGQRLITQGYYGSDAVLPDPEPIRLTLPNRNFTLTLNNRASQFSLTLPDRAENP